MLHTTEAVMEFLTERECETTLLFGDNSYNKSTLLFRKN
jgi:hypothetical protein